MSMFVLIEDANGDMVYVAVGKIKLLELGKMPGYTKIEFDNGSMIGAKGSLKAIREEIEFASMEVNKWE